MPTAAILTALPNGVDGDELLASVHVSLRLTTPTTADALLGDFPLVVDWPATLAQVGEIRLVVDGTVLPATVVSTPSSATWQALFPAATTGVFSHTVPDYAGVPIHSYPAGAVQSFLAGQYGRFGTLGAETFPAADDLLDAAALGPLRFTGRDGALRKQQLLGALASQRNVQGFVPSTAGSVDPALEFLQVLDFHTPPTTTLLPEVPLVRLDIHRAISFAQNYPTLLRLLGLVLDVRVRLDRSLPTGPVGVEVDIDWGRVAPPPTTTTPTTAALLDPVASQFVAQPNPSPSFEDLQITDGVLPFDNLDRYQVVQVDTDGAAEKVVDLAGGVHQATNLHRTSDTPADYSLPSLRTGGVAVARVSMAGQLARSTERSAQLQQTIATGGDPALFAEDVARGLRIDVYDVEAGRWYPLCARTGQIKIGSEPPIAEDVEGWVSTAPTSAADDSVPDLYLPETLFHWVGWSLTVARPGAQIANRPDVSGATVPGEDLDPNNEAVSRTPAVPHPDIDLVDEFAVPPGTLPRLRFGSRYRLRARVVDLAGNGEPFGDPTSSDFTHATPEFVYRRFEPVQSPAVVLRDEPVPAEEVERIVVRTDNDTASFDTPISDRHVVPPKQSQSMNEQLRLVDTGPGGAVDAGVYALLAGRDAERLDTPSSGGVAVGDFDGTFRFPQARLDTPYLPDGLAQGATLRYVDGPLAGQFVEVPFRPGPNGWPDLLGFRLRAVQGAGPAQLVVDDANERVMDVPLRPADIVRIRISSDIDESDLGLFAVWQWILDYANSVGVRISALRDAATTGRHWMLTPHRTLTFVHAVKRPLATPEFDQWTVGRVIGSTSANVGRLITINRPSTQQVELIGTWEEPVDLGAGTGTPDTESPFSIQTKAIPFHRDFEYGPPDLSGVQFNGVHEFNDTKRRDVTYTMRATSRFPEHFTATAQLQAPPGGQPLSIDAAGVAPGTLELRVAGETIGPRAYQLDPVAGSVVFGDGSSGAVPTPGDTIDATYVPGSITQDTTAPAFRIVPSSARPAAPSIRYVIPTFGWNGTGFGSSYFSSRTGGGLRVYLDRPWWTSGEGELLGVVTLPAAEPGASTPVSIPNEVSPYVTQWGNDPIYSSQPLPHRHPRLGDFTRAVDTGTLKLLAERDVLVNVAGHEVGYDADRDLWYCDITVEAGAAYNPLIRLALARYQPESLDGVHLSPVVLADFSQLAPDRSCVVLRGFGRRRRVFVYGPSYTATEAGSGPGEVDVVVERRETRWGDETVGWRQVGRATRLSSLGGFGFGFWTGLVTIPEADRRHRLVITQYERFRTDDLPSNARSGRSFGRRAVYTDIIPID